MNNLNNLSDEELDKLFWQSAEESDIEFDERAWQKMNSLLDEKQPLPTNWRKYSIILLAIFFLGSTILYFGNENRLFNSLKNGVNPITKNDKNSEKSIENIGNSNPLFNHVTKKDAKVAEKQLNILGEDEANIEETKSVENLAKSNLETEKLKNISKNIGNSSKTSDNNKADENSANTKNVAGKNKVSNNLTHKNGLLVTDNEVISKNESKVAEKISVSKNIRKSDLKVINKSNLKAESKKGSAVTKAASDIDNRPVFTENSNLEIAENVGETIFKSSKIKNNKRLQIFNKKGNTTNNKLNKNKTEIKGDKILVNPLIENTIQIADLPIEKTYLQNISLQYLVPKTNLKYVKPTFEVEVNSLVLAVPEPMKVEFYKKGLAIRIALSPDISTISSNKISKIGSNFGGILEYRFSDKLSVQAGVFRSMKYYDAKPDQYSWVWGYSRDKLVDIAAKCKMMDFPINLRYDILAKGTTRIFVGAGATTYKMMNETYKYNYVDNTSPTIKHHEWIGKTGTYYTSNLNLLIGLEKYISKNFTIQVEPFAKSPLRSIGFGKVPLITYGMMISGKYPLNNLLKK